MYDDLAAFVTKIKLCGNRNLSDSLHLAMYELYNANPWTRTTGTCMNYCIIIALNLQGSYMYIERTQNVWVFYKVCGHA